MNLFNTGKFILHSGDESDFKIDCDALSDEDIESLAKLIAERFTFGCVEGVPTGGLRLADALEQYVSRFSSKYLLVDDVYTTGHSIYQYGLDTSSWWDYTVVIFARNKPHRDDIYPIFQMWDK